MANDRLWPISAGRHAPVYGVCCSFGKRGRSTGRIRLIDHNETPQIWSSHEFNHQQNRKSRALEQGRLVGMRLQGHRDMLFARLLRQPSMRRGTKDFL